MGCQLLNQPRAVDLPGRARRDLVDENIASRALKIRELRARAAEVIEGFSRELAMSAHYRRRHHLAPASTGQPYHRRIGNLGVLEEEIFDF